MFPGHESDLFGPNAQTNQPTWHYIDCASGAMVSYDNLLSAALAPYAAYQGGVFSPSNYLVPFNQANQAVWHYIQEFSSAVTVAPSLMASALFNKL